MLYDRPYMRDRAPIQHVDYFWWSFWIFVGSFLLQNILGVWFGLGEGLYRWLALSVTNVLSGKVWTIFTYSLLHGSIGHFFGNGIGLFFIGRWLSRQLQPRQYLQLILGSVFMGGLFSVLFYSLAPFMQYIPVIGFSAAVMGMLTTACLIWPSGKITMLLFFVAPVEFNPRTLLKILLGLELLGFIFVDLALLMGRSPVIQGGTAFTAHLGGMFAGYLFYKVLQRPAPIFAKKRQEVSVELPQWTKKRSPASSGKMKVNLTNRKDVQREVDRILDKINRDGFGSLSPEEQKILDEAGDLLKK